MHNNYAVITARVLFNKELTSTQKLLIAVISNLSNTRGYCFASNQYLGECIGLSKHTVRDAIADLEKKLVLIRVVKLNAQNEVEFRSLKIDVECDFLLQSQVPENIEDPYAVRPSHPPADEPSHPLRSDHHTPDGRPSHNNKDKNKEDNILYISFLNLLNSLTNHKYRPTKKSETQFNARIKEGWTAEEVAVAVRNAVKVEYHQSNKFQYLTPEFFTRADKLNMYSQNANDSLNDEEKYKVLFAKGWKNCDQAEVEWAYDYQHRDEMSYSKYVRTELLGNRGSKKTAAEYDAE